MPASLGAIRALLVDMDGVLWRGSIVLPGVAEFFSFLSENAIRFLLATNNATRTIEAYIEGLHGLGIAAAPDQILTSAYAAARWLRGKLPPGGVLVIGEDGLFQALALAGFRTIDPSDHSTAERPAAVVVGLDRRFTYEKLRRASEALRAGALFVATNADATFPAEKGLVPGAGSLVAALKTASGVEPVVIGKPYRPMFETALDLLGTFPDQTAMLGDRLDTDIEGGRAAGLVSILVLTGVTTRSELDISPVKPDFTFPDLIALRERWAGELRRSRD